MVGVSKNNLIVLLIIRTVHIEIAEPDVHVDGAFFIDKIDFELEEGVCFFCFFFCLDAKETKNQGQPDRAARLSGLRRRNAVVNSRAFFMVRKAGGRGFY